MIEVYTAITGNKDNVKTVPAFPGHHYTLWTDEADYVKYLDRGWHQVHKVAKFSKDKRFADRRNARLLKILSCQHYPDSEYTVWMDGSHSPVIPPAKIIEKYLKGTDKLFAMFKHPVRDCIFQEAQTLKGLGLDHPELIDQQMKAYRADGMPAHFGLPATTVIIRKTTHQTREIELMWWEHICKYSSRDQLSLPYVLWKTNSLDKLVYMEGHWQRNNYIRLVRAHNK